ncbi:hypothetical protein P3T27_002130 [Kitasatospora sp. MAA19]|uniref:DUF6082 family protein n=1 Tax=Kitasatospora sp. MAA19 TaxID=3035090 RepID=UPI002473F5A7|nr:DUF6082 family protein [Kitasatospora sp. MAA19]MDH6705420.1 hypothetical protein [Kitasatospora sp. MAA19]
MKSSRAVLILAGVVAVQTAVGYFQHRERVQLDLGLGHQQLVEAESVNPQVDEARKADLRANRVLTFIGLKHQLRVMGLAELRVNLKEAAKATIQKDYWQRHGGFRRDEADASGRRKLRVFVTELGLAHEMGNRKALADFDPAAA